MDSDRTLVDRIEAQAGSRVLVVNQLYGNIVQEPAAPPSAAQRERLAAIRRIREDWIDGFLNQSLLNVARVELKLQQRREAVEWGLNALVHVPQSTAEGFPDKSGIADIFDKLGESLLILGEAGCGKTTLLLELAQVLLERARLDPAQPIPAVLTLSTWAKRRRPLGQWIVSELNQRHGIPKRTTDQWLEEDNLILLLDGLDEVDPLHRLRCLETINTFRGEHGLARIAVCSRISEYEELGKKISLRNAVVLLPLDPQQVDAAVASSPKLTGLSDVMKQDRELRELMRTPLMLWVAALAFSNSQTSVRWESARADLKGRLFSAYVEAMFERRGVSAPYDKQRTLRWVSWLARALRDANLTVIDPSLLTWRMVPARKMRITAAVAVFVCVAVLYSAFWVAVAELAYILSAGLMTTLTHFGVKGLTWDWSSQLKFGWDIGSVYARALGPLGALIAVAGDLKPINRTGFEFRRLKTRVKPALVASLSIGMVSAVYFLWLERDLVGALEYSAIGAAIGGCFRLFVVDSTRLGPRASRGVRYSAAASILATLAVLVLGVVVALRGGLWFWILYPPICGGLLGGLYVMNHYSTRLFLWATRAAPWKYRVLLDYATERILLRKVGTGYVFAHRMLLEFLAAQQDAVKS